ncbi:hypothetical protein [Aquibacillus rhizosphaerae]|uniref:Uncharacterized protein n=1 Tax=Aquibacillus rhizosphaerae TaxID=3051431 RepID=A0ABT7L9W3_9BACI|nr:hypothetical protein [Aquibacillus sp. LR5S19]MDL4841345.1 hypothetical protein [Aquibacillus sp. LR5S19]
MKKWLIIALGGTSILIWLAVIWVFLAQEDKLYSESHSINQISIELKPEYEYVRFNEQTIVSSESVGSSKQTSTEPEHNQESNEVIESQQALNELVNQSEVSIDDLLSALDIQFEN